MVIHVRSLFRFHLNSNEKTDSNSAKTICAEGGGRLATFVQQDQRSAFRELIQNYFMSTGIFVLSDMSIAFFVAASSETLVGRASHLQARV